jgi:6-phosphogluconolactonase
VADTVVLEGVEASDGCGMTTRVKVHRFADREELSRDAASAVLSLGAEAIESRGRFVLALSGGNTPRRLYEVLAESEHRRRLDWSRAEFFWGDERSVAPDHHDSNYRMARESLLDPLDVAPRQVHRMQAERPDLVAAANDYAVEIARCFDTTTENPPPRFDLVLLGLGEDGHTASLFPYTRALTVSDRWVSANEVLELSTTRMTMTFALINRARVIFFLVAGRAKSAALADAFGASDDIARFPNRGVRPQNGRVEWFVDEEAAAGLAQTGKS